METIGRDLHRQFPLHEMFVSPQGHGYEASDAQGPPASQPQAFWPSPPPHPSFMSLHLRGASKAGGGEAWAEAAERAKGCQED